MSVNLMNYSIAEWCADQEQHKCGYCKNPSGSVSYGMVVNEITVEDYKDLIDRGWRRSGKYCYKPTMDKTCCPQYTIKCDVLDFNMGKSHKKIIKKFNKFVNDGVLSENIPPDAENDESEVEMSGYNKQSVIDFHKVVTGEDPNLEKNKEGSKTSKSELNETRENPGSTNVVSKVSSPSNAMTKNFKCGTGADSNKPPCKKAKLIRLEKKMEKMKQKGLDFHGFNKMENAPKSLQQLLEEIPATSKHKFRLKLVDSNVLCTDWNQVEDKEYELYYKYQRIVHNDPPNKITKDGFKRFLVISPLKIVLERMSRHHKTFKACYQVYLKYQEVVHNDPSTKDEFYSFLVETPLKHEPFPNGIVGPGYGSFHQQYWLDDKLIAVAVIDILPGCVSSVYFFYDPDYRSLTLGTYGSLREIQFVRDLQVDIPDLRYYYMGFYIHSCPKMRYKGKLSSSMLLCPETYVWIPIEQCLGKLDVNKYSRLNEDIDAVDDNRCSSSDIDKIKMIHNYKLMHVRDFVSRFGGSREVLENLGQLVGRKTAHNIIFWIS